MPSIQKPSLSSAGLSRRAVLKGAGGVAAASILSAPFVKPSYASTPLRVSNFGGFFEKAFAEHVYPEFTKTTGIEVQSIAQSGSAQFLVQLGQAVQAGSAPMDICCTGQEEVIRGRQQGLWATIEESRFTNLGNIMDGYVYRNGKAVDGVGAMAWYITMIANPNEFEKLPDSWTDMWKAHPSAWGFQGSGTTMLFDIVASVYFEGPSILDTEAGIDKVIAKIAELKPNAKLWWTDEGSMQTSYQNDEVIGGMYYHDVAMIMKDEGTDLVSIFPKEGAVLGFNAWCVPKVGTVSDQVIAFLDWTATPACHELIVRHVGSAPLIERAKLKLTDAEFARASGPGKPIVVASEARVKHADYMSQQMLKMMGA
ncbi:extracellular solute-binding protein [Mesorhizobium sp. DCY119]|uniref:ABC transporter substrate-binding protein n=1 Tax=Mesorhizobium sp. DCY119 TaxID=2108445 RepID=UPI000E71764B|nr:extracellular solute-binding protein [Mesorhizobium sp. DCY119]RJG39884.1 extracellular solute-binding protein [Mesorhizobium sp. DCY119]